MLAAATVRRFGIEPKAALLPHSDFGSSNRAPARRMREAVALIRRLDPGMEVEGEMHAGSALSEENRDQVMGPTELSGQANLLVMPSLDAANITYNALKELTDGESVGPMLLGLRRPAHILQESVSTRGILDMTAVAVVDAQINGATELPFDK